MDAESKKRVVGDQRKSLKVNTTTPIGAWRERFRQGCLQNLKNKRNTHANTHRRINNDNDDSDDGEHVEGEIQQKPTSSHEFISKIMIDEWGKIKRECPSLTLQIDGFKKNNDDNTGDELENMDTFLQVFEDIQAELLREEEKIIAEYNESVKFDEEYLCAAIEHLNTQDDDSVLCPLCKLDNLKLNFGVVFCGCGLRVDTRDDAIDLKYIRAQLEGCTSAHARECAGGPLFGLVDFEACGVQNVMMSCHKCDYIGVII